VTAAPAQAAMTTTASPVKARNNRCTNINHETSAKQALHHEADATFARQAFGRHLLGAGVALASAAGAQAR
jgi:hypothetical protein